MRALALLLVLGLGSPAVPANAGSPSRPARQLACHTADDCSFTHYDEACCFECPVTVGRRTWVESVEKVCRARRDKGCRVPACGQARVDLACVSGQCVNR